MIIILMAFSKRFAENTVSGPGSRLFPVQIKENHYVFVSPTQVLILLDMLICISHPLGFKIAFDDCYLGQVNVFK